MVMNSRTAGGVVGARRDEGHGPALSEAGLARALARLLRAAGVDVRMLEMGNGTGLETAAGGVEFSDMTLRNLAKKRRDVEDDEEPDEEEEEEEEEGVEEDEDEDEEDFEEDEDEFEEEFEDDELDDDDDDIFYDDDDDE